MRLPPSIELANLPTKIERLDRLSNELGGPKLYIKRDDETGSEVSGNKVRKLEYIFQEAIEQGCDYLITCGGIQSNHARATAAVATKLGMGVTLVLVGDIDEPLCGNYFLNKLLGADIRLITSLEYENRMDIMKDIKSKLENDGHKPYIISEGGSMGIGCFGYYQAMKEIEEQELKMGVTFDAIVVAVGSGGTYGGLFLGNKLLGRKTTIYGFNVSADATYFQDQIDHIIRDSFKYLETDILFSKDEIKIIEGYVGKGYAQSSVEELAFIHSLAKLEGIILDPVYTGKAMYGLTTEIKKGNMSQHKHILFIHTGGLFGVFPKGNQFFK